MMPELVGNSHRSFPEPASKAWNIRSDVPPLSTSPPPVASIGPQFEDRGYVCVQARVPVSTFQACTSPIWLAPGAMMSALRAPVKAEPGVYFTGRPSIDVHRFSL